MYISRQQGPLVRRGVYSGRYLSQRFQMSEVTLVHLVHQKAPLKRILQWAYAQAPVVVLETWVLSGE